MPTLRHPHGLVIEFQHSPIEYDELVSREAFYKNMIWVVDGDRSSLDPNYFTLGLSREPTQFRPLVHLVKWWGQSKLLHRWSEAKSPVYIDFGWMGLWRYLHFWPEEDVGAFSPIELEWLVESCASGEPIPFAHIPEDEEDDYVRRNQFVEVSACQDESSEVDSVIGTE